MNNSLLPFELILALRFMREARMQTLLIMSGVALGVSVIVFISALINGLQDNLFNRTLDFQAQIVVLPPKEVSRSLRLPSEEGGMIATLVQPRAQRLQSVDQWQKVEKYMSAMDGISVVSLVASGAGLIVRGEASKAVGLTGIEPDSYLKLIALNSKIISGNANLTSTDILVGLDLAKDLGVWTSDKLNLQTASGNMATLNIRGVFDFGNSGTNSRTVYIALRTAQNLLGLTGGVTSVEANLNKPFDAERFAQTIQAQTGLKVDSWISTNAQFFSALEAQSMSNNVIRFFVGLTAALGIASVLVVSVVQKSKAIGILRATGTSQNQILRLFLLQGALTGLVGSLLGAFAGWLFLAIWRSVAINDDGTQLFPIAFEPMLFLYAAVGATLVGILAALFPALKAARLDPAVAIRG